MCSDSQRRFLVSTSKCSPSAGRPLLVKNSPVSSKHPIRLWRRPPRSDVTAMQWPAPALPACLLSSVSSIKGDRCVQVAVFCSPLSTRDQAQSTATNYSWLRWWDDNGFQCFFNWILQQNGIESDSKKHRDTFLKLQQWTSVVINMFFIWL